jgi:hypothetical protein
MLPDRRSAAAIAPISFAFFLGFQALRVGLLDLAD